MKIPKNPKISNMLYYLVRLIDPVTHEIKFWSLDQKVKLPHKKYHQNFPECFLEIKTGSMSELKPLADSIALQVQDKTAA